MPETPAPSIRCFVCAIFLMLLKITITIFISLDDKMTPQTQNLIIIGLLIAIIICLIVKVAKVKAEGFDARCTDCAKKFADITKTRPGLCNQLIPSEMEELTTTCKKAKTLSVDERTKYVNDLDILFSSTPSIQTICGESLQLATCGEETDEVVILLRQKYNELIDEGRKLQESIDTMTSEVDGKDLLKEMRKVQEKIEKITAIGKEYLVSKNAKKTRKELDKVLAL